MDVDFWDDRTLELYDSPTEHPCYGCIDFFNGDCISNGACSSSGISGLNGWTILSPDTPDYGVSEFN